jgi:F420-dependent oxidoreductase-like protein
MVTFAVKTPPQHGTWAEYLDVWRAADDIDVFGAAWNFDHFYPLVGDTNGPCLEGWTMLAALAQATKRLRLGCMVTGGHYRHPAVLANMAATIDHISGGRLIIGLGAGWYELESKAYGIPLGSIKERMDRFDETVETVVRLLRDDETTFAGQHVTLTGARCEPKPIQRPHPPIAIGGGGERRTLRTAARWAQQWDGGFTGDLATWQHKRQVLAEHCATIGRDPTEIATSIHIAWHGHSDPAELAAEAAVWMDEGVDHVIFAMRGPYSASLVEPLATALRDLG